MINDLPIILTDEKIDFADYIKILSEDEFANIMGMHLGDESGNFEKEHKIDDVNYLISKIKYENKYEEER